MPNPKGENLRSFIGNPCQFPFDFDEKSGGLIFMPSDRDKLSRASFLDGRESFAARREENKKGIKEIISCFEKEAIPKSPWNFIFHTGFCCSTLLARCLDQKGDCLSLKEPKILNSLSSSKNLINPENETVPRLKKVGLVFDLLFRKFSENEKIIIKPSNADLVLIEDVLALNPSSKMVFIYSDLKNFLIYVAKGGQPRRDFIRRLLAHLLADLKTRGNFGVNLFGMQENLIWTLSDLHISAAVWFLQMKYLEKAIGRSIFWLNSEDFLGDPKNVLKDLSRFFDVNQSVSKHGKRKLKKEFTHHAKAPEFNYSPLKRKTEFIAIENYLSPVLPEILSWADEVFPERKKNETQKLAV